jgi:hypothetical protein
VGEEIKAKIKKICKVLYLKIPMIQINLAHIMEKMKLKNVKKEIRKYKNNKKKLKINSDFNKESLTKLHNLQ